MPRERWPKLSVDNQEALAEAMNLADGLKLLAKEYQAVVRSTSPSDERARTARRSLDRKFQKLRSRVVIQDLQQRGYADAAGKLDNLFGAAAMVFNLMAVSIGVDEAEVLEIDIEGPHGLAMDALKRALIR